MNKAPTKAEKKWMDRVAELGCVICQMPACLHHIRHGQGTGQRASHYEVIGLCIRHHQGPEGIHHLGTRAWEAKYGTELEHLERVRKELGYQDGT